MNAFETFRDVGHDRDGSALELIAQTEIPGRGIATKNRVEQANQLAGELPSFQVLEGSNSICHRPSPISGGLEVTRLFAVFHRRFGGFVVGAGAALGHARG
ncbi:MAG TPA: hypothetical protein VNR00_18275, partial [Opitutus sp.]|nr:hypothetical protein [Opitutus sp.]